MAVTTGAKELAGLGAAVALIQRDAAGLGATSDDGVDSHQSLLCGSLCLYNEIIP
jgi:hypothetical protein